MPKLEMQTKTKQETYGRKRHEYYTVTIPHVDATEFGINSDTLHCTMSEKTGTIRLHRKKIDGSIPVRIRSKYR